jgi:hypothetical protein
MKAKLFGAVAVMGLATALFAPRAGFGEEPRREQKEAAPMKLPQTPEEHLAMAKEYDEKAAEWRKEAAYHHEMAIAYARQHPDFKGGVRNPWAVEMEKHCAKIAGDAERLAADAADTAKFHRFRAKELQGK